MNLDDLLEASKSVDVAKAFADNDKKTFSRDERYFNLRKKNDVGRATLRFLPNPSGGVPFVKRKARHVKFEKNYYVEWDRTTIPGLTDPADEFRLELWKRYNETEDETWKKYASMMRVRERYISLVYVVEDPLDDSEEANSGQTFLFEYGPQVYNKIVEATKDHDEFGARDAVNPFSLGADGANFGLLLKRQNPDDKKEIPDYESSKFLGKGALFDGDRDALQNMLDTNKDRFWPVTEEIEEDKFKSYDELRARCEVVFGSLFKEVMGGETKPAPKPQPKEDDVVIENDEVKPKQEESKPAPEEKVKEETESDSVQDANLDEDDLSSFFD